MAEKKFLIENYGKKSTFASFLPGISGEKGIPIWCYYVNRGQCVVSFGVDNKDHSIMEFYPAHQAYQNVKTTGFRTFVKKDGKVTELFADENRTHRMEIARNGLKIEEENDVLGVNAKVDYFTLPGEKIGALVRRVELTNTTGEYAKIEVLDGMPALIPYGVGIDSMKICARHQSVVQVEDVKEGRPYFRVRASMAGYRRSHKRWRAAIFPSDAFLMARDYSRSLIRRLYSPMILPYRSRLDLKGLQ